MSMQACPNCGATIAVSAKSCPNCGQDFQQMSQSRQKKQLSFLIGLLALFGIRYNPQSGSWKIAFVPATITVGTLVAVIVAGVVLTQPAHQSGKITEFAVPTSGGGPLGIAAGPDGNLWFTEAGNKIGRVTPYILKVNSCQSSLSFALTASHSEGQFVSVV